MTYCFKLTQIGNSFFIEKIPYRAMRNLFEPNITYFQSKPIWLKITKVERFEEFSGEFTGFKLLVVH